MDEADLPAPVIAGFGMRQSRNEAEIRQLRRKCCKLVEVKEIALRAGSVEEAHGPLLAAFDMVPEDRPERRHARSAADHQHRLHPAFASETSAVGSFGQQPVAGLQTAVELRRE